MAEEPDDEVLLAAVRAGDTDAFGAAFDRHVRVVHRYCARRSVNPDYAEDLTSVVFLEAWRTRDRSFVVDASLRPWLLGIARNVVRNANRSVGRHRAALSRLHSLTLPTHAPDHADAAVTAVDAPALRRTLAQAIGQLTAKQRDVVELCLVEQMSPTAAAAVLGVPSGTVKSRLADARVRLRELLRPGELAALTDPHATGGHQGDERPSGASGKEAASWTR